MLPNCTFAKSGCTDYVHSVGIEWSVAAAIWRRRRITSRPILCRLLFVTGFDAVAHMSHQKAR